MERESQYTISSVKKALKVLKLFDSAHKSMTLTEISERADMRKGTMVRVLTTLEEEGFVRYDEISKRYSLGMSIYVLSSNAFQFISVVETARPYLEKVTTELNLIAHLSVLEGEKIVLIDLNGLVAGAQHIDFLSLEEFRIAGRTVSNPMPGKFLLALDIEFPGPGAQIQDDAARHEIPPPLCLHNECIVLFPDLCHGGALKFYRGMAGRVFPKQFHQVLPAVRFRSRIIPDFIRIINPSAIAALFQQQCPALGTSGINGC